MKTDFAKYRRCALGAQTCGVIGLLLLCVMWFLTKHTEALSLERLHVLVVTLMTLMMITSGIGIVLCLLMMRYTKCPYCGESVLSKWWNYGRGTRIHKHLPIICPHCGEEIETE